MLGKGFVPGNASGHRFLRGMKHRDEMHQLIKETVSEAARSGYHQVWGNLVHLLPLRLNQVISRAEAEAEAARLIGRPADDFETRGNEFCIPYGRVKDNERKIQEANFKGIPFLEYLREVIYEAIMSLPADQRERSIREWIGGETYAQNKAAQAKGGAR